MTGKIHSDRVATDPTQALPEFWPADEAARPLRPIRLPWPIVVLLAPLLWVMPKRLGPQFAAAGWRAAIVAHLVWVGYAACSITMSLYTDGHYSLVSWLAGRTPEQMGDSLLPVPTLWETLKAPVSFVAVLAFQRARMFWGLMAGDILEMILIAAVAEAVLIVVAILLAPYISVGERTRRLLGRSVRLMLWATTSLIVPALILQVLVMHGLLTVPKGEPAAIPPLLILGFGLWVAWLFFRAGSGYAGPAEGPAWSRQGPQCLGCGYRLTGLSPAGTCPECGLDVEASLPGRRVAPPFGSCRSLFGCVKAYGATMLAVLGRPSFFSRLETRGGLARARLFAVITCMLAAAVGMVPLLLEGMKSFLQAGFSPGAMALDAIPLLWGMLGVLLVLLLGGVTLVGSRLGWRAIRPVAVAVLYWSAWLIPLAACFAVLWLAAEGLILAGVMLLLLGVLSVVAARRLLAAVRCVRFVGD